MKPRKMIRTIRLDEYIDKLGEFPQELDNTKVYLTNTRCGTASLGENFVTIPKWALNRLGEYFIYYIAHELSHILARIEFGDGQYHNRSFYSCFKRLCPQKLQRFEVEYKPRNAAVAGISKVV